MKKYHQFTACCMALGVWVGLFYVIMGAQSQAENLIQNSGLESEIIKPWAWNVNGGCEVEGKITSDEKHAGSQSFFISRKSPAAPNVYGALAQHVSVKPGTKYHLSLWCKGSSVTKAVMICGKGWKVRKGLPVGTFDWQKVELDYTALPDETSMPVLVIADGPAEGLWVDDIQIEAEESTAPKVSEKKVYEPAIWKGIPASGAFYPILPVGRKLPQLALFSEKKPRFGAWVEMGRTATDMQMTIDVEDPTPGCALSGEQLWRGDGVQLAIDIGAGSGKTEAANTYFELGFAFQPNGTVATYAWVGNFNWADAKVSGEKTEKGYKLSISIPWKNLYLDSNKLPRSFGMNMVINDADKDGVRRFVEWTLGTATMKNPDLFARVFIADPQTDKVVAYLKPDKGFYDKKDSIQGKYVEYAMSDLAERKLSLNIGMDKASRTLLDTIPMPSLKEGETRRVDFDFPAAQLEKEGEYVFSAEAISGSNTQTVASVDILRQDLVSKITRELAEIENKANALKKTLDAKPQLAGDSYLNAGFSIVQKFTSRIRNNLSSGTQGIEWTNLQADELQWVLEQMNERVASQNVAERVPVPTGPVTLKDGFFYAKTKGDSKAPERVYYYYGYGHFGSVRREAEILSSIGSRIIQQENGPRGIKADMSLDESVLQGIQGALSIAEKNDMKLDFLLSPHYFPKWGLEKAPDVALKEGGGFIKHNIDHPLAKKVEEAWLKNIVPKVKDHPGLFSFGLSNEPVWSVSGYDEYSKPEWFKYLKETHGSIDALNKVYESSYKNFEEVPLPQKRIMPDTVKEQRLNYDWAIFNMEHFAEWHKWMNGIVKAIAPNVPTHAKIMAEIFDRNRIFRGVDPELFCEITDLAGNDCWAWSQPVEFYAYSWQIEEMWYDLLHSFKGQSVFNSENHFIRDRSPAKAINPEHTRCIFWQGALHHQGVTTSWVWEEANAPDLEGSVYFRPANIYAGSKAMLDLNRLAEQVKVVSSSQGEVAILYSVTSIYWEEDYTKALATAYAALNFSGQQVTFVSEKQLASGQRSSANEKVRYIIIPRATHVKEETIKGLGDFIAKGGKILMLGEDNLKYDEYHRERKLPTTLDHTPSVKWAISRDELCAASIRDSLEKMGLKLTYLLQPVKNEPTWGLEYRIIPQGKSTLLSITNMMNKNMEFRAPFKGKSIDLISGKNKNLPKMELAPMESVLLQID